MAEGGTAAQASWVGQPGSQRGRSEAEERRLEESGAPSPAAVSTGKSLPAAFFQDLLPDLAPGSGSDPGGSERLLLNHAKSPGFLASGGEEFNPGPEMRLDRSELLCYKVLLKNKGDRESF